MSQAIVYLSLKNRDLALQLAKERSIDWATGVDYIFQYGNRWVYSDPALADWLGWLSTQLEPSAAQVKLLLSAARHQPAGAQRLAMFRKAAQAWRDAFFYVADFGSHFKYWHVTLANLADRP